MNPVNQTNSMWIILVAAVASWSFATAQDPKKQKDVPVDEVTALIDRLTEIDQQDTGYSASMTGSAFLPFGKSEFHTGLLFQKPHVASDTLKSLVKLGPKAVPKLIEHLKDERLNWSPFFGPREAEN